MIVITFAIIISAIVAATYSALRPKPPLPNIELTKEQERIINEPAVKGGGNDWVLIHYRNGIMKLSYDEAAIWNVLTNRKQRNNFWKLAKKGTDIVKHLNKINGK